jgi:pyruvate,water dikinase
VAEDSAQASFAGQLQTHLNVPSDRVAAAVVAVWRSAEAAPVTAYRQHVGCKAGDIAVLVQAMIPAEVSGVVFTADPLTGAPEHLVINAAWGLGEGVAGGLVTPDHWMVERTTADVQECRLGEKAHMVVAADGGGTRVVPTPVDYAARLALTPEQVTTLAALALRVEAQDGAPQDVEWAYEKGHFWVL